MKSRQTMRIAITDANIFIDLFEIGWIEHLFQIDLEIVTTLEVFNELSPTQQSSLIVWQDSGDFRIVEVLLSEHSKVNQTGETLRLSFSDRTVLFIAIRDNLMVLTGDKLIRRNAERLKLEVHGILWVFERIVSHQAATLEEAIDALHNLMRVNDWLPMEECMRLIGEWKGKRFE